MTDFLNSSLELSPLVKALERSVGKENPFLYTNRPSPPPESMNNVEVGISNGTLGYGNTVEFLAPRTGINVLSYLKVNFSGTGAPNQAKLGYGGIIFLFKEIQLVQNDLILQRLLPEQILARVLSEPENVRDGILTACGSDAVSPFAELYMPLLFTCYEQLENAIDTDVLQQFTVRAILADSVYKVAWANNVDTSTIGIFQLPLTNNSATALAFLDDGSIQSAPTTQLNTQLYIDIPDPEDYPDSETIGGQTYYIRYIQSATTLKYLSPYGQTSTAVPIYHKWDGTHAYQYEYINSTTLGRALTVSTSPFEPVVWSSTEPATSFSRPTSIINLALTTFVPTAMSLQSWYVIPQQPDYSQLQKKQFKLSRPLDVLWTSCERETPTPQSTVSVVFAPGMSFGLASKSYNMQYLQLNYQAGQSGTPANCLASVMPATGNWQQWGRVYIYAITPGTQAGTKSLQIYNNNNTPPLGNMLIIATSQGSGGALASGTDLIASYADYGAISDWTFVPAGSGWNIINTYMVSHFPDDSPTVYATGNGNLATDTPFFTSVQPEGKQPEVFYIQDIQNYGGTPYGSNLVFEMPLNCRKLVHTTYVFVRPVFDTQGLEDTGLAGKFAEVSSIEVFGESESLFKYDAAELKVMNNRSYNRFKSMYKSGTNDNFYVIQHGLESSQTKCTGGINLANIKDASMRVICKNQAPGTYELIVIHDYFEMLQYDGSDGRVTLSYSY